MAASLKTGDQVLQTRRDGSLRTIYLQGNRVVGFQLVGDIKAAGVLRGLMNSQQNVGSFKDKLLDTTFGQGTITWKAMAPWV